MTQIPATHEDSLGRISNLSIKKKELHIKKQAVNMFKRARSNTVNADREDEGQM